MVTRCDPELKWRYSHLSSNEPHQLCLMFNFDMKLPFQTADVINVAFLLLLLRLHTCSNRNFLHRKQRRWCVKSMVWILPIRRCVILKVAHHLHCFHFKYFCNGSRLGNVLSAVVYKGFSQSPCESVCLRLNPGQRTWLHCLSGQVWSICQWLSVDASLRNNICVSHEYFSTHSWKVCWATRALCSALLCAWKAGIKYLFRNIPATVCVFNYCSICVRMRVAPEALITTGIK